MPTGRRRSSFSEYHLPNNKEAPPPLPFAEVEATGGGVLLTTRACGPLGGS